MFFIATTILFFFIRTNPSYGWPASNFSKSTDSYGIGALDDEVDWSQHPCKRECRDGAKPLTCRYGFTIENYVTMSKACYDCPRNVTDCSRPHCIPGDGNPKMVVVANRCLPGPAIEVCKGDRIVVDVTNSLIDQSTTIHWHGLHMRGTPFMDGVPMVSQCPIMQGTIFRYDFKADRAGTFWWHSHTGMQRGAGLFGALVIKPLPSENRVGHLYNRDEHWMIVNDWSEVIGTASYTLLYQSSIRPPMPHTIFVNGLGPYGDDLRTSSIPRPVFRVKKGTRHRFRVISAVSYNCPMRMIVDGHPLLVISADGADVEPLEVDAIRINSGERYDFVLNADREVGNYWIRFSGSYNCRWRQAHQEAILRYEGAADVEPSQPTGYEVGFEIDDRLLNPDNQFSETKGAMCISCSLTSLEPDDDTLAPNPDHRYYLNFDMYHNINHVTYFRENLYGYQQVPPVSLMMQINHLSYKPPSFPLLQTKSTDILRSHQLCNVTAAKCTRNACSCPHVLQLELNSIVELVLVDEASRNRDPNGPRVSIVHPVHLHGFYFRVLATERLNETITVEQVKAWDKAGKIHRKLKGAPLKDVLDVPRGGYAIVRIRADNPGYWFVHCHAERHSNNGMAMVFKVGEDKDFPPTPADFPKCSNY